MNCQKAGDLLSAYIDGELVGRQGRSLETHLTGCVGCREELDTLRSALALLEAPKTMTRAEGLLEEFKTQYLPETEAASAGKWSFRLPAMPKLEWPTMGRVMFPMGGIAAAAAALLVAFHGQPTGVAPVSPLAASPGTTRVAMAPAAPPVTHQEAAEAMKSVAPRAPLARSGGVPAVAMAVTRVRSHSAARVQQSAPAVRLARVRHRVPSMATAPSHERARSRRSRGLLVANNRVMTVPPVSDKVLLEAVRRHQDVVPTDEAQWSDQIVAISRKAPAATAEDGFAEVSCKNLATGEVKTAAIGMPTASTGGEARSGAPDPGGNR